MVVGGGLAGVEAAWQIANRGIMVDLYEMRPQKFSPAHHTDKLAELVCSNSLKSNSLDNAAGILKEEMRMLGSIVMESADINTVPAGEALAVDRERFSQYITEKIISHPNINVIREEVKKIPEDRIVIIAVGPLPSESMTEEIEFLTGSNFLYFYDAAAPIITYDSIDLSKVFKASRYGKGDDYINCPMTQEEYERFWNELVNAEVTTTKEFEEEIVFEGCMPIEAMAKRGKDTLLFGPLKPVGLVDPRTGKIPYAVVQLRQDNKEGTLYNMVGFQTKMKWGEQKRVFSMIPGLENAEFVRFGVMHRNTFIDSPRLLLKTLQLKNRQNIFFAGQITGVEGYIESASSGIVAGINAVRILKGFEPLIFPKETAVGALCHYITDETIKNFQPMNINMGLFPKLDFNIKDRKQRNIKISERAIEMMKKFIENFELYLD